MPTGIPTNKNPTKEKTKDDSFLEITCHLRVLVYKENDISKHKIQQLWKSKDGHKLVWKDLPVVFGDENISI